jgi:hypothetical protein
VAEFLNLGDGMFHPTLARAQEIHNVFMILTTSCAMIQGLKENDLFIPGEHA